MFTRSLSPSVVKLIGVPSAAKSKGIRQDLDRGFLTRTDTSVAAMPNEGGREGLSRLGKESKVLISRIATLLTQPVRSFASRVTDRELEHQLGEVTGQPEPLRGRRLPTVCGRG